MVQEVKHRWHVEPRWLRQVSAVFFNDEFVGRSRRVETEGHLLRPVTPTEHRAVEALLANPVAYGMEDLIPHLLNGAWYSGDIISWMPNNEGLGARL